MFIAAIAGLPLPLLSVQILWVNLVTDVLPAMALEVEINSKDIMQRPPRSTQESIFSGGLSKKNVLRGMQIGLSTVGIFAWVYLIPCTAKPAISAKYGLNNLSNFPAV